MWHLIAALGILFALFTLRLKPCRRNKRARLRVAAGRRRNDRKILSDIQKIGPLAEAIGGPSAFGHAGLGGPLPE